MILPSCHEENILHMRVPEDYGQLLFSFSFFPINNQRFEHNNAFEILFTSRIHHS